MLEKNFNFEAFKAQAIASQPLMRQVKLSEIEFASNGSLSYRGVDLSLSKKALSDLYKILGFGASLGANISETFNAEMYQKVANIVKIAKAGRKDLDMQLVVSPVTRKVESILSQSVAVNVDSFFKTFDRIANDSDLDLRNASVDARGQISLSCVSKAGEFQVGKMSNEVFHPGLIFSTDLSKGTALDAYIERLVCTNGMVRKSQEESLLMGITAQQNSLFFERLEQLRKNNFMPINFTNSVLRAQNVNASFGEVETVAKLIKSAIRKGNEKVDDLMVSRFIPYFETKGAFAAKGLDTFKLNDAQKANAVTNVKVWDVINGLTDFASHDYGYDVSQSTLLQMQVTAGKMFDKKSLDTQNLVSVSLV